MSAQRRCEAHFGASDRRCTRPAGHIETLHTLPNEISWPDTLVMRRTLEATLRSGELFAGVGGLGMAVNEVFGADPAWFSEFDAAPSKVLAHHYPDVPNFGDVRAVKWTPDCPTCGAATGLLWRRDELSGPVRKEYHCREHGWFPLDIRFSDPDADRIPNPVDVLVGGFPCQDVSLAGRRAGMKDGTRSGLWSEYLKAIDALRPDWVVIENVRGLYSARADSEMEPCTWCLGDGADEYHLRALDAVLADLSAVGFDAEWTGLRAADVGAPHGRFRVFILAWPRKRTVSDASRIGWREGRAESTGTTRRSDDELGGADARLTLLPTPIVSDGTGGSKNIGASDFAPQMRDIAKLLPTTTAMDANASGGSVPANKTLTDAIIRTGEVALLPTPNVAMADGGQTSRSGSRKGELLLGGIAAEVGAKLLPTPNTMEHLPVREGEARERAFKRGHMNGSMRSQAGNLRERVVEELADVTDWGPYESAILRWESVIGRPAPAPVRFDGKGGKPRLNPELTEWMMGWPAGWVTADVNGLTRAEQLKACGNGVVPQQASAALRILLARPGVPSIEWEAAA